MDIVKIMFKTSLLIGDFPGGPVVKTLHFQCSGRGVDPWSGAEIPHAMLSGQIKNK